MTVLFLFTIFYAYNSFFLVLGKTSSDDGGCFYFIAYFERTVLTLVPDILLLFFLV